MEISCIILSVHSLQQWPATGSVSNDKELAQLCVGCSHPPEATKWVESHRRNKKRKTHSSQPTQLPHAAFLWVFPLSLQEKYSWNTCPHSQDRIVIHQGRSSIIRIKVLFQEKMKSKRSADINIWKDQFIMVSFSVFPKPVSFGCNISTQLEDSC